MTDPADVRFTDVLEFINAVDDDERVSVRYKTAASRYKNEREIIGRVTLLKDGIRIDGASGRYYLSNGYRQDRFTGQILNSDTGRQSPKTLGAFHLAERLEGDA